VVFLDKDGAELYSGPNTDLRALGRLCHRRRAWRELRRITGHSPALLFAPAKLRWFKANRPAVYERIATILSISSWYSIGCPDGESPSRPATVTPGWWTSAALLVPDLQETFDLAQGVCPR